MNWKALIPTASLVIGLASGARGDPFYTFEQRSEPQGIFTSQSGLYAQGTNLQTVAAVLEGSTGYSFGYWTVNGQRASDVLGQAVTIATLTLYSNTTAIAWYFPTALDTNSDGVADHLQWRYYGSLANGTNSDTEGDGFGFAEELTRGYSPVIADQLADGGVMLRLSEPGDYRDEAQLKRYQIRSEPQGVFAHLTGYVTNGTPWATPTITYGATSGYYFGYWEINGVRQADASGAALPGVLLPMTNDTVAIARFFSSGDGNSNGLEDWYEWYWFGDLNQTPATDPDTDGFTIAEELTRGYSPVIADQIADGGVMLRLSEPGDYRDEAQLKRYQIRSEPQGVFAQLTGYVTNGTAVATPTITYGATTGYYFGYWEVNEVRQADGSGAALPGVLLPMTNDTVAIARFFPAGDANSNGLEDWYEWHWFGDLNQTPATDPDTDGFTIGEELTRGYSPVIADQIADGGVMLRLSEPGDYRDDTQLKRYQIRSDPQGVFAHLTGYVTNGTPLVTPTITYGVTSGHYFGYWEINGVRQADASGAALPGVLLPMINDTVAIARFFPASDSNSNGLEDWYEWYWFGDLSQTPATDPDTDGFTIADELTRGYNPVIADQIADGGVMMRLSAPGTVGLSYYPRITQVLVNGVMQGGFVTTGDTQGSLGVSSNSAPAIGDWNGDGVPDLAIGGANGQLRFFQNSGSPIVPNFVEDTLSATTLASLWTNLSDVSPALGDWSGDGFADLAIGGSTNVITLISSINGFSNSSPERIISSLTISNTTQAIPSLAVMGTNSRCDLYVLVADGTVDWFPNTGVEAQPFAMSNCVPNLLGSAVPNATGLAVADMNHDGFLEVLISDQSGSIHEFRGGSNNAFVGIGAGFAGSYAGFASRLTLAAGDLFGEGDTDLLGGFAAGGLVCLKDPAPHLLIRPPSVTVTAGQPVSFSTINVSGQVDWRLLRNPSGGSIDPATGDYQSGPSGGSIDFIEAAATSGLRGRAYVNVINPNDVASFGKAVVIAGGRDLNDPVWLASDYIANKAYNVLLYKGYARDNIRYLSFDPGRDVDGDGLANDTAGFTSFTNAATTFTNWVGNANRLFVYLVDHGSASPDDAYFRLNTAENLNVGQLNTWLTDLQDQHETEVVVVLDFCYAGRFLQDLAYEGSAKRVVIAATSPTELTYFLSGGFVSFSDLFLSGMLQGLDLQQSFLLAQQGMSLYQHAVLDDNGNGLYESNVDGAIAASIPIGATHLAGKDVPIIGEVASSQTLSSGTTATLWADGIQSYYPIERVYCTILPPGFSVNTNAGVPVTGVSEVQLATNSAGRYQASFDGFTEAGLYRVNYYARDVWGSVSPPQQGLVIQAGFDERMILVTGGTTNDAEWPVTTNMTITAYRTALARRLDREAIQYLSAATSQDLDGDGTNDVAGPTTLTSLANAITNWAVAANKLTVYLLGSTSTNGLYRMNETESLSPAQLDLWLDDLQETNRSVVVVMDFDGSGGYVSALLPPNGRERINLASTKAGALSLRASGGLVSFSQFFLNGVFNSQSLGAAFNDARDAIRIASGRIVRQTAGLDDSGNGAVNEKNVDGVLAAQRYLGGAFATGEDAPFIGAVSPSQTVVSGTPVVLWAQNILSAAGISNVWCVITPPDYVGTGNLPQTSLTWNGANNRYEVLYSDFTLPGTYACTFYARDNLGALSGAKQCEFTVTDAYEVDDFAPQAAVFTLSEVQLHNFHDEVDEDWVKFYAPPGWILEMTTRQLGTNSDTALELYYERADGSLELADWVDDYGWGSNVTEILTLDLKTGLSGLSAGVYYLRVSSADVDRFGPSSEYEILVYVPAGGAGGVVTLVDGGGVLPMGSFYVYLGPPQALADGAAWQLQPLTNTTYYTNNEIVYAVPVAPNWSLSFQNIPGFATPTNRPLVITADQTTSVMAYYVYTNQSPRALIPVVNTNGALDLTFLAHAGNRYSIERSTNLVDWILVVTNQVPPDGLLHFTQTNFSTSPYGFVRTRLQP